MSFNNKGRGILINNNSTVYYSYNSAAGFASSSVSGATMNSVAVEGNDAYIAGNGNKIYHYNNLPAGTLGTYTSYTTSTASSDFKKIVLIDRKSAYITGTNGQVLKMTTASGALQFAAQFSNTGSSNTSLTINTAHFNARGSMLIGGASGYIRSVEDDAQTISNIFWYDELGRLVVSQNTKQFNYGTKAYSYTQFDALGRIIEVGETVNSTGPESNLSGHNMLYSGISSWVSGGTRREVSATYYDDAFAPSGAGITQVNLRKRVASITYEAVYDGDQATYDHASHYSYDIHGNVDVMVQEVPALSSFGNEFKKLRYEYDLISGKVNSVHYNETKADQYHHRYTYDADNRITHVESSRDHIQWDNDASYYYYPHGPLMRAEIGDLKVQGVDFAYTLHGWIKGVNAGMLDPNKDMGADAKVAGGNNNQYVGRDAFGYILGYFEGDYTAINSSGSNHFVPASSGSDLMNFRENLYNGNITTMQTALPNCSTYNAGRTISSETFGNSYNYDQLNRLKSSRTFTNLNTGTNTWGTSGSVSQNYSTDYSYDANGNITELTRWGNGTAMDEFTYNYDVQGGRLVSNKLYHVNDNTALSSNYPDDIDDQGSFTSTPSTINTANNYGYDELGNLSRDDAEEIASIEWNVQGKISKINRSTGSSKATLEFTYDAQGQRLSKKVTPQSGIVKTFYYIRDAMGNEMCRYVAYSENSVDYFVSEEHSIYGSSRLGVDTRRDTLYMNSGVSVSYDYVYRHLGKKQYELSNHLGNVLASVTDQKKPNSSGGTTIDNYDPVIVSISDYYPFGSVISTRSWSDANGVYRFGFNGKEKDFETASDNYDFGARIYDGRLGRWLSLDPLMKKYSYISPYAFCANNPIIYKDIDGKDFVIIIDHVNKTITIFAIYYTETDDAASWTASAVMYINKMSGLYSFVDENGVIYDINFELKVIQLDIGSNPELKASGIFGLANPLGQYESNEIDDNKDIEGNSVVETSTIYPDALGYTDHTYYTDKVTGTKVAHLETILVVYKSLFNKHWRYTPSGVVTHEILHTLGVSHEAIGKRGSKMNKNAIGAILLSAGFNILNVNSKNSLIGKGLISPRTIIRDLNGEQIEGMRGTIRKNKYEKIQGIDDPNHQQRSKGLDMKSTENTPQVC